VPIADGEPGEARHGALSIRDQAAVQALHDDHVQVLYAWARRRFSDRREAEEVVQDTLVLAWRKRHQYDPERGSERAWLFGILRNVASSRHRSTSRGLHVVSALDPGDERYAVSGDIDRELESAEIADAVAALNDEHRAVIIGAYFRGIRMRSLANELGIPEGTVKSRLYYGLRNLRVELEERGVLG
jgi:RNA polymerase sigma-70 factor (ECF subfamily)